MLRDHAGRVRATTLFPYAALPLPSAALSRTTRSCGSAGRVPIGSCGTAPTASLSIRPVVWPSPVAYVPDELLAPLAVQSQLAFHFQTGPRGSRALQVVGAPKLAWPCPGKGSTWRVPSLLVAFVFQKTRVVPLFAWAMSVFLGLNACAGARIFLSAGNV